MHEPSGPSRPQPARPRSDRARTFTGNRGAAHRGGADLRDRPPRHDRRRSRRAGDVHRRASAGWRARRRIGLPGLSEPEAMRHYVRLVQKNYGIDTGLFPLGSCTMKHNPRLNEKMARLPGFGDIHPLQPLSTVPGALALIAELARWLCELTGMPAVAMTPKAGAHGELCGMMAIKAALEARGEQAHRSCWCRNRRTAPIRRPPRCSATASKSVPARADGTVDPRRGEGAARRPTSPRSC